MQKPKLIAIVGPTAAGKTDYAIQLAKQMSGAVVSADSRQVYSGLNIGTAKPQAAWQSMPHDILEPDQVDGVAHYLLNIREPKDMLTLADWQMAAQQVISTIMQAGQTPLLVGGTMLYVDSIVKNFEIPAVAPNETRRAEMEKLETQELYERLHREDPDATKFIEPHHKQRIIRALEVIEATGKPFSAQRRSQGTHPYEIKMLGLFPGRSGEHAGWEILAQRIEERATQMLEGGLLEETQALRDYYGADLPLLKTMNYRQAAGVLDGVLSPPVAVAEMKKENLRYARRQMSWWKNRREINWISESAV